MWPFNAEIPGSHQLNLTLLRGQCTIKRNTPTNVNGNIVPSWAATTNGTGVRCLIQEKTGSVSMGGDGAALIYDAVCFLPPGTDIQPRRLEDDADQLIQTKPASNVTYLVRFVSDRSGFAHHLTAYLKRLPSP